MFTLVILLFSFVQSSDIYTTFTIDYSSSGGWTHRNTYNSIITWNYKNDWAKQSSLPENTIKKKYSFLEYVQLFTATGGCYSGFPGCNEDRDLLVDPTDPSKGYDFSPLVTGITNVIKQGLLPHIVTGNVPVSFSENPKIGGFGVNTEPPKDWNVYYAYIKSLAETLVTKFGFDKVKNFKWGVLTEYNNHDWYTSKTAYFQLYNTTVSALLSVIPENSLRIGAHACTQCRAKEDWDPSDFIDFVVDNNLHIWFMSNSFYERSPGDPGALQEFHVEFDQLKSRAKSKGLYDKLREWGVDEGRLLWGPEKGEHLSLLSREVGESYQGSFDAFFHVKMRDENIDYYSRWTVNSMGLFGPDEVTVDAVSTNVARLLGQLDGKANLRVSQTSSFLRDDEDEDATHSYWLVAGKAAGDGDGEVGMMVFNHYSGLDGKGNSLDTKIVVENLTTEKKSLQVTQWVVDDEHMQFWPQWWSDMAKHGIDQKVFMKGWSIHSSNNYVGLSEQWAREVFMNNIKTYQNLAQFQETRTFQVDVSQGRIQFNSTLIPNSVHSFTVEL